MVVCLSVCLSVYFVVGVVKEAFVSSLYIELWRAPLCTATTAGRLTSGSSGCVCGCVAWGCGVGWLGCGGDGVMMGCE